MNALVVLLVLQSTLPLTGRVREAARLEPVRFALVEVEGGRRALTDQDGFFVVQGLSHGEHRLRVTAPGYRDAELTVTLPGAGHLVRLQEFRTPSSPPRSPARSTSVQKPRRDRP